MLMRYPCDQQYPFGSSGVVSRPGLYWRCWLAFHSCCPLASVCGVVAHEQLARRCCRFAMVAVAVCSSCVSIALLLINAVTACLSAAISVARFASAYTCCCCMSYLSAALACPPLMQFDPYPSDAYVRCWTHISRNSLAKKFLKAYHVFSVVSFRHHYLTPS